MTVATVVDRILNHVVGTQPPHTPLDEVEPQDGAWGVPWYAVNRRVRGNLEPITEVSSKGILACLSAGFELLKHVVAPCSDVSGISVIIELRTQQGTNSPGPGYEMAYVLHGGELAGLVDSVCPERRCISM